MRALGRAGGKARRKGAADRLPSSLREELRKLDPAVVRGAIEQALAGNNESARVSAVKLLADVDAFRRDGACPECVEREAEVAGARARLAALLEARADPERADPERDPVPRDRVEEMVEALAQQRLQALREEHGLVGV